MNDDVFGARGTWGNYFMITPSRKRRKDRVPPPTREEIEQATAVFLMEGGRIDYREAISNPGELAQCLTANDFTECGYDFDLTNIF